MRRSHQASRTISLPSNSFNAFPQFSGDGSRFVANAGRVPVKLKGKPLSYRVEKWNVWDMASGEVVATVSFSQGDGEYPVLNHDGSRLAIVLLNHDEASGEHEHLLMVIETATGREIVRRTLKINPYYFVHFSPDGRKLAAIASPHEGKEAFGPGDALLIWDAESGDEIRTIPGTFPRDGSRLVFSPDGKRVAATIQAGDNPKMREVKLWDVESGREDASFPTSGPIDTAALRFSPDGQTLAAVAVYPSGDVLHLWDVGTARSRFSIPLRSQGVNTRAAFSPDGRRIACVFNQLQVGVWDTAEGKLVATYQDDLSEIFAVAFGRDGRELLAADSHSTLKIWDATGEPDHYLLDPQGQVVFLAVSPDARWIAAVVRPEATTPWGNTPVVKVWNSKVEFVRTFGHSVPANDGEISMGWPSWSARGDRLAYASLRLLRGTLGQNATIIGGELTVWDLEGKEHLHLEQKGAGFIRPSLDPDGRRVAAIRHRGIPKPIDDPDQNEGMVWDIRTGRVLKTLPYCTEAMFDARGLRLVALAHSPDRSLKAHVWDTGTWEEIPLQQTPELEPSFLSANLAVSPDGRRMAVSIVIGKASEPTGTPRFGLAVWDVASGKLRKLAQDRVGQVAFSPDGARIAAVYGSTTPEVGLWDAQTGRQLLVLKGHGANTLSATNSVAFSPDGRQIVSAVALSLSPNSIMKRIEVRRWDATPWKSTP